MLHSTRRTFLKQTAIGAAVLAYPSSKILGANPMPLPSRVPGSWRGVVGRSLRKEPAERYACAGALAAALADAGRSA